MQHARLATADWTAPASSLDELDGLDELNDDERGDLAPGRLQRFWDRMRTPEAIITLAVVLTCTIFTFVQLQPSQLFKNTTPAGGDMGAHVWLPEFVRQHLIPNLRITGWAPDWYEGFPALTYYFPGPMFAIAFLSYVIPYNIAFKLISVAGLVALPVCAWAFGRLARMPFPGPACLAVGALAYLFGREFTIYGGNIASTMAGEFSFSISLSFALLFLGVAARGMSTGRLRAIGAVLLAATALCHILPTFFAVGGALILFVLKWDWRRLRWLVPVFVVSGFAVAVWALPFELRLPFATNMGYQKITTYLSSLFLPKELWLYLLAGIGFVLSLARKRQLGVALGLMALGCVVVFRFAPNARLWNARVLPFWFLCLYLLAAVALAELCLLGAEAFKRYSTARYLSYLSIPVVVLLVGLVWVGYPLWILPGGHTTTNSAGVQAYDWLGIKSTDHSYVSGWVNWNYSGYQSPGKPREKEYFALVDEMKKIGLDKSLGCGTALWQYEPELNDMGTPDALMLLPYWTNGCIGSEEGLYYESSASTPYHFLNVAEVSEQPSDPMVGLDYPTTPDVAEGVDHMQIEGVKYFMAETPTIEAQADKDPSLKLVASVGPYPVNYTSGATTTTEQRTWKIYEVKDTSLVTPLQNQPVVISGLPAGDKSEAAWLAATQTWYLNSKDWTTYETASGPDSWERVDPSSPSLPQKKLPAVTVSDIHQSDESISFNVSRVGVPVLVKESYFPNWHATGASEVYRSSPNFMVVIPTAKHVTLNYGYTPLDWIGFVMTILGLGGIVVLARRKPVRFALARAGASGAAGSGLDDGDVVASWAEWAGSSWQGDPDDPSLGEPTPPSGTPAVAAGGAVAAAGGDGGASPMRAEDPPAGAERALEAEDDGGASPVRAEDPPAGAERALEAEDDGGASPVRVEDPPAGAERAPDAEAEAAEAADQGEGREGADSAE